MTDHRFMEQLNRRSFWLIAGWTVVIFTLWCCAFVALSDLETRYKMEDRV